MALFNTYSRSSKEMDKVLKEKMAKKAKPKGGKANNLLTRINTIKQRVDENLGEYKNDYEILIKDDEIRKNMEEMKGQFIDLESNFKYDKDTNTFAKIYILKR